MEQKGFRRKLTAILSADVAGYSRLMQDDEAATVKTLEAYKQIISDLVKQHRGRVVDSPGDNLLSEFASVVDAVQCAVATQKELQARNTEFTENRKMQFRIGVNLGDVIEEGDRIYGDGVNIAARLESLADPGGICVSKTAFDQIETKLPFGYEFLGEQTVKNIAKPVGAYRVVLEPRVTKKKGAGLKPGAGRKMAVICLAAALVVISGVALLQYFLRPTAPLAPTVEKADPKQMALPLPELPSIAVLPFVNLSEDPKQELLCDGVTDNIINAFSKVPQLFVIARNSTFTYKGKAVKAKHVSEELGVRYVMEGSVQRSDGRVRISVQLVDALTASQLLSERFDGETTDLFSLQDDITLKVLNSVRVKLEGEGAIGSIKYFKEKQGLDCMLKGLEAANYIQRQTIPDTNLARQAAEEGLRMCPENPYFYRYLAMAHQNDYWLGSAKSPTGSIEKATELLQKALAIDDGYVDAHAQLSHVYTIRKEYDKSVNEGEMAVSLAPGSAWTLFWYATALSNAGRPEEALPLFEKAIRLNPLGPMIFHHNFANALRQVGRLEEAVASYKKAIERSPNYFWAHAMLAVVYSQMGKDKEAQAAAAEVMRINPKFSLEWVAKVSTIRDSSKLKELLNTMRKAGLPDKPPLPLPDKPSIAVLPFVNLSEDSKQQLLCDGITENIINALAKVPQLFVIARNSTFTYKGKTVAAKQVSEELGVRYVLEGSVQRSGERVRITVQMVDALTGNHLFAERYDGEAADLFALQDDITMKVIGAVRVKLEGLGTSMWMKYYRGSQGLDCFLKFQDAIGRIQRMTVADTNYARQIAEAGLVTCQEGPAFYRLSAIVHLNDHMLGSSKDPQESISKAEEFLLKALAIDDKDAGTLGNLSQVHTRKKEYDKAIAAAERAVTLDPGSSWALYRYAIALNFAGRPEQAIPLFEKAIRLNPLGPSAFYFDFGIALRDTGKMDEAVATLKKSVERAPNWIWPHAHLAVTYSIMGMDQEARAEAAEVLRINPRFSIEWVAKNTAYDQARMVKVFDAMRKAGLPEKPPSEQARQAQPAN